MTTNMPTRPAAIPAHWLSPGGVVPVTPEAVQLLVEALRQFSATAAPEPARLQPTEWKWDGRVTVMDGQKLIAVLGTDGGPAAIAERARLVEAAPRMLEALRTGLEMTQELLAMKRLALGDDYTKTCDYWEAERELSAVIAAATGQNKEG